jgi:hypothetical protein
MILLPGKILCGGIRVRILRMTELTANCEIFYVVIQVKDAFITGIVNTATEIK